MKVTNKRSFLMLALLMTSLSLHTSAHADSKVNPGKGKSSTSSAPISSWVSPAADTKKPTIVQAGRTVPTRFTLVVGSNALTTTDMVEVALVFLDTCDVKASVKNTALLVTAAPAPTTSTSTSASASTSPTPATTSSPTELKPILDNSNGVFNFNWKVPKTQKSGCYQLKASKSGSTVTSPLLLVKGTK